MTTSPPAVDLITVPFDELSFTHAASAFVLELDLEHGNVQTFGEADVIAWRSEQDTSRWIESSNTGGCYSDPSVIGQVELYAAEEHRLAVFFNQDAMLAGARQLVGAFGDQLPVGIQRVLTAA